MHIKKFDSNYSRRFLMKQVATGALATGVLAPMWPTIAMGRTLEGVYPDEISSFEGLTKGKINNEALYLRAGHKSYAFGRYHGKERQQCQLIELVNCR